MPSTIANFPHGNITHCHIRVSARVQAWVAQADVEINMVPCQSFRYRYRITVGGPFFEKQLTGMLYYISCLLEILSSATLYQLTTFLFRPPMTCPVCNAQNSAMSARCLECGTILIQEAIARPEALQQTVDNLDRRMYIGYGGLAGFVVGMGSWMVISQDEAEVKGWLLISVMTGAALGRFIAWRRRNTLE
ncbi:hypothetical protein [Janthinobacterium sp. FW305-128]|uniref:hypothetical protein n=1 Tax=Janthinobacterium sp. FW305-128 TaxID=2775055 RepID=UPI001E4A3C08|nr:hypothetical protein [Janthinobacterium sp. FW305-128]MCC7683739.1 hypothetical protein [Janthinobacterium sp. FW305-128]